MWFAVAGCVAAFVLSWPLGLGYAAISAVVSLLAYKVAAVLARVVTRPVAAWEQRTHPYRSKRVCDVPAVLLTIGIGSFLVLSAVEVDDALVRSLVSAVGTGTLGLGCWLLFSLGAAWVSRGVRRPHESNAPESFATYKLLFLIHSLKDHQDFPRDEIASVLFSVGMLLERAMLSSIDVAPTTAKDKLAHDAAAVRGVLEEEGVAILIGGRRGVRSTLLYCQRLCGLVLVGRWVDIAAISKPVRDVQPVKRRRLVRTFVLAFLPLTVWLVLVGTGLGSTTANGSLFAVAVVWAIMSIGRAWDDDLDAKVADVRTVIDLAG